MFINIDVKNGKMDFTRTTFLRELIFANADLEKIQHKTFPF